MSRNGDLNVRKDVQKERNIKACLEEVTNDDTQSAECFLHVETCGTAWPDRGVKYSAGRYCRRRSFSESNPITFFELYFTTQPFLLFTIIISKY